MAGSPQHVTLTANTITTFTFDIDYGLIEVLNVDGADIVYVSTTGVDPAIAGIGCDVVPAALGAAVELRDRTTGPTIVKVISAGTPKVSVRGL